MPHVPSGISAALSSMVILATGAAGQSVQDIVDDMYAAYERQAQGIDDYTLVQTAMGIETLSYFEKEMVEGRPIFRLRSSGTNGVSFGLGGEDTGQGDVYLFGPQMVEHGRYAGRDQIDGNPVHVIAVDDASQLDMEPPSGGDMEFTARTLRLFIDAELSVPRRMEFVGDARTPDGVQELTMRMDLTDIRDVRGMLIPHRTLVQIEGMEAMIDPEMQAQLAEMERQLAAMPADQRQMMERMLGPQMEQIRAMMGGAASGGGMNIEVTVSDVRVNTGPPRE
ncbi:MAG: hypothetical protein WEB90_06670 [Gemmatimonadota bacterium]